MKVIWTQFVSCVIELNGYTHISLETGSFTVLNITLEDLLSNMLYIYSSKFINNYQ